MNVLAPSNNGRIIDPGFGFRGGAPVEHIGVSSRRLCSRLVLCLLWALTAFGQQTLDEPRVPTNFNLDLKTAARLRPQLFAQSIAATGRYATGRLVLERLIEQLPNPSARKFAWELRIIDDDQLNAYSSPDGTIYIENGLAQLAGPSTGLWAAILSHEIAHVVRRDWARRYLYQKSLETGSAVSVVLGDPGLPSASWTDSQTASGKLALFCRRLEVEADREGLMLMARAGYHPDFVPALHHLLHAQSAGAAATSLYAMHPCWEQRDRELSRAYSAAGIEFEHRWPEWYATPGGNPPVVIFAEPPTVRKTASKGWEIEIPMHCENLVGAVEVVVRARAASDNITGFEHLKNPPSPNDELRQLTGCTSLRTTITFTFAESSDRSKSGPRWTDVYVLDPFGAVLTRAELPKLPR